MTLRAPLSTDDLALFEQQGYVRLPHAFPRDAALRMQDFMWAQLRERNGIEREDRSTWSRPWSGLNKSTDHEVYQPIASPALCGAIDQFLGPGAWHIPTSWGGFLISFPADRSQSWALPTGGWHWDGNAQERLGGWNARFIFTFFSFVVPRGGGTLVVAGSHRLIDRFVQQLSPDEFDGKKPQRRFLRSHPWLTELAGAIPTGKDRERRFMEETTEIEGVPVRVVELTGEPGDAVLCHPSLLHVKSPNCAEYPRFMRVKYVRTCPR